MIQNKMVDINKLITSFGVDPLNLAISIGNPKLVKLLVDNGADVDVKNKVTGITPLFSAKYTNKTEIIKILKKAGAKE